MSNYEAYHIRVTMDGNKAVYHMMFGDTVLREMSYIDVMNLALNATSSLRWARRVE